mmetsp:Transcript_20961/g.41850  ORF Transcript_20961/g.41850 Transcript_20961/m.41850 type:complete len:287 (-) Transcript_20961:148-1008(-)
MAAPKENAKERSDLSCPCLRDPRPSASKSGSTSGHTAALCRIRPSHTRTHPLQLRAVLQQFFPAEPCRASCNDALRRPLGGAAQHQSQLSAQRGRGKGGRPPRSPPGRGGSARCDRDVPRSGQEEARRPVGRCTDSECVGKGGALPGCGRRASSPPTSDCRACGCLRGARRGRLPSPEGTLCSLCGETPHKSVQLRIRGSCPSSVLPACAQRDPQTMGVSPFEGALDGRGRHGCHWAGRLHKCRARVRAARRGNDPFKRVDRRSAKASPLRELERGARRSRPMAHL